MILKSLFCWDVVVWIFEIVLVVSEDGSKILGWIVKVWISEIGMFILWILLWGRWLWFVMSILVVLLVSSNIWFFLFNFWVLKLFCWGKFWKFWGNLGVCCWDWMFGSCVGVVCLFRMFLFCWLFFLGLLFLFLGVFVYWFVYKKYLINKYFIIYYII